MLSYKENDKVVIASLVGMRRFDCLVSEFVKNEISEVIEKTEKDFVLDLEGVNFIDSQGFAAIESMADLAKSQNTLFSYQNVSNDVMELVNLVGMKDSFLIFKN